MLEQTNNSATVLNCRDAEKLLSAIAFFETNFMNTMIQIAHQAGEVGWHRVSSGLSLNGLGANSPVARYSVRRMAGLKPPGCDQALVGF
jgi:hypothetical protein